MQLSATFDNWNFLTTWAMDDSTEYPMLRWNTIKMEYKTIGNGSISGDTFQYVLKNGISSEVTATPEIGYKFVSWSDGGVVATRTDLVPATDTTLTATFAIDQFTVTYSTSANGSITGTEVQKLDFCSITTEVTATPASGYKFVSWSDGSVVASRSDTVSVTDTTLTATFAAIIAVSSDTINSVTLDTTTLIDTVIVVKTDTIVTTTDSLFTIDSTWIKTDSLSAGVSYWDTTTISEIITIVEKITIDTFTYIPTLTVTVIPTHSIVKDSVTAVDSVESGLDTIVTTIRTENTTDSLFTQTDSLSDGKSYWFKIDTAVVLSSVELSRVVDTLYGSTVEILVIENKSVEDRFTAYPNPIQRDDRLVTFELPNSLAGEAECYIYDVVGNLIDKQVLSIRSGSSLQWDLTNKVGQLVGSGTFVVLLKVTSTDGSISVFKTMVGVRQ